MRKCVLLISALLLVSTTNGEGLTIKGDPAAKKLVGKAIKVLGGRKGIEKRRRLFLKLAVKMNQQITLPNGETKAISLNADSEMWIKGEKTRMEQTFSKNPGTPQVIINDGKDLFLLTNGIKRDPGRLMKQHFRQGQKREKLWWNCFNKKEPLKVSSIGEKTIRGERMQLLEFTHPDNDKTIIGLNQKTSYPIYLQFQAASPYTGKTVWWTHLNKNIKAVKKADGLLFPHTYEVYQGINLISKAALKKVKTPKSIPDSLFGKGKGRPVD